MKIVPFLKATADVLQYPDLSASVSPTVVKHTLPVAGRQIKPNNKGLVPEVVPGFKGRVGRVKRTETGKTRIKPDAASNEDEGSNGHDRAQKVNNHSDSRPVSTHSG